MSETSTWSRWLRILLPIVILSTVLAACSGSAAGNPSTVGAPIDTDGQAAGASAAPAVEAPAEAAGGEAGGGEAGGQLPGDDDAPLSAPLATDRKVVYTGSLELVVDDLAAALAKARTAVLAVGGYIGASEEHNDDTRAVATISYRIPAERWDATVESLRGIAARVVGGQTQAVEVGAQIVDLEARLRNLRASESVLVGIAEGTGRISDLLEVQARISEVRGEIERIDAQRAHLEDQAAYGTLVVTFGTEVVQVQQTARGWDPADDVDGATATLVGVGQTLVSGGIWFGIVWLPVLLVLVVVALVGRRAVRRFWPRGEPAGPLPGWGAGEG
jgi:hypothetical protein